MQAQAQAAAQAAAAPTAATNAAAGSQPEEELSALERFCTDVTDEARQGMLDPLVGRDDELRACSFTFSLDAQRTIPCFSVSPASARPLLWRVSRNV